MVRLAGGQWQALLVALGTLEQQGLAGWRRLLSVSAESSSSSGSVHAACLLERLPVIMAEPEAWEIEFAEWQAQLQDRKRKPVPEEFMNPKDISTEEEIRRMQEWEPEPRETHADTTGDASTAWRRLDRRLVLLVKHSDGKWGLPIAEHRQGETIRQTAERALNESVGAKDGGDLRAYFVGNAPAGHVAAGVGLGGAPPGGTIFVHRAQLLSRADGVELQGSSAGVETAWIARDEVDRYADSEEARVFLHKLLID